MSPFKKEKIGIFGSGLIGGSWAMIFASVGYQVRESQMERKLHFALM